jgi:glycosyltransferase involved in cell wall biosynthesis
VIRVFHLINDLEVGGAEVLLLETLRRIDRARFDVRVASLLGPGRLGARLREAGIEVIDLSRNGRFTWRAVKRMRELLRARPCDILHCHLVHATLIGRWLRRRRAVPCMVSTQHFAPLDDTRGLSRRLHRLTARWDDMTIAVSPSVAEDLSQTIGVDPAKVTVIENGLDLTRFHPGVEPLPRHQFGLGAEHFIVGTTASLTAKKGLDVLISAAALTLREAPRARFLIAGEGPERSRLESLIEQKHLTGRAQLIGAVDQIERFLTMLDAFCLPSRRESFGLSAAEAMACGRAVVHSAVGGLRTLSEDGVSGLHVKRNDDPSAFAAAILHVIREPDLRRRLGEAAAQRARERFGIDEAVGKLQSLYERLLTHSEV